MEPVILANRAVTFSGEHVIPIMVGHIRVSFDGDPLLGVPPLNEDMYIRPVVVHREDGVNVYHLLLHMLSFFINGPHPCRRYGTVKELVATISMFEFLLIECSRDSESGTWRESVRGSATY